MSRSVTVGRAAAVAPSGFRYRRVMAPNRAFDFIYDPLYTLSSERDHAQATVQSHLIHDEMIFDQCWQEIIEPEKGCQPANTEEHWKYITLYIKLLQKDFWNNYMDFK